MKIPRSWRAGDRHLVWNTPGFAAPDSIAVTLPDVGADGAFASRHAGAGVGGNVSPTIEWAGAPAEAKSLWLIVQDPDAPIPRPPVHLSALIDAAPEGRFDEGALNEGPDAEGFILRKGLVGRGWQGPRPIRGHGPHAYVVQFFALDLAPEEAHRLRSRDLASHVLARGRAQATFERL